MESLIHELIGRGIPEDLAKEQVRLLKRGTLFSQLNSSASIGDGIVLLEEDEVFHCVKTYEERGEEVKVLKFVPASGAATRMFKDLNASLQSGELNSGAKEFMEGKGNVAFANLLPNSDNALSIIAHVLDEDKLNLDNLPKGSILFHKYKDQMRTAFEEHLVEGADYADSDGQIHIHFTLSAEHITKVQNDMKVWVKGYGEKLNCTYDLEYSVQAPSTDTMPTDMDGNPIRNEQGDIFLRPGGHGSLIYNLNGLSADIIFIKNIDNVVPDQHRSDTILYKKALAGKLMQCRKEARGIMSRLKGGQDAVEEARDFLVKTGTKLEVEVDREELIRLMNRPYRVCGMVPNQGEPGGGPFWVQEKGRTTLQIVETAQIDTKNDQHISMLKEGTHFNPVDLVCSLNDLYGAKQNLLGFVDMEAAFVTEKVVNGIKAKVVEWPGLWNGAMADWNTMFVEVPISTFNPVKSINDLLRPMHQES